MLRRKRGIAQIFKLNQFKNRAGSIPLKPLKFWIGEIFRMKSKILLLSLVSSLALSSCLKKSSEILSFACSGFSNSSITYYSSPSECQAATGASTCAVQILASGGQSLSCFYSSSGGGDPGPGAASLSFVSSSINLGAVSASSVQNFQVRNLGGSAATGCIASIVTGSPYFSANSNSFDVFPGGSPVSVPINVNFTANANLQNGYIKITCQNSVQLLGGSISANFGASGGSTGGPINGQAVLALDTATSYSVPAYIQPPSAQSVPQVLNLTVKNNGSQAATGCFAYIKDANGSGTGPSSITITTNQSFHLPAGNSIPMSISMIWNSSQRAFKLQISCSSANTPVFLSPLFTVPAGGSPPALSFTPDGITVNSTQTVSVTISNNGSTAATNCNVSLVQLSGAVDLNNPPANFTVSVNSPVVVTIVIVRILTLPSKAKLKVTCSQGSWTSTNYYQKL
jgi:hypothetical protein